MKKTAVLMLLCSVFISAARAQSAGYRQTVTVWSDGPAVYAEVDTHEGSVYKVFGYRASGVLAEQKPPAVNAWVGVTPYQRTFTLKNFRSIR